MRFFVDTEFIVQPPPFEPELVSLAIVAEDGRELYRGNESATLRLPTPFFAEHVLPQLPKRQLPVPEPDPFWAIAAQIREEVLEFIGDDVPEFWGDSAAFDFVLFSRLIAGGDFGTWPAGWPFHFNDVQQELARLGPDFQIAENPHPHDALCDARQIRDTLAKIEAALAEQHAADVAADAALELDRPAANGAEQPRRRRRAKA